MGSSKENGKSVPVLIAERPNSLAALSASLQAATGSCMGRAADPKK